MKALEYATPKMETAILEQAIKRAAELLQEKCSYCESIHLQQNGSCKVCMNCGETTGCS